MVSRSNPSIAMIPIGYTVLYGMINFAHGELFVIGAFALLSRF